MIHERFDIFRAYRGKNTDFFYGSPDTRLVQFKHVKGGFFFLDRAECVPMIPHVDCHILKRSRFDEAMVQQVISCELNDKDTTVTINFNPRLQTRINDRIDTGFKRSELPWVRLQQIIYCVNDFKTRNSAAMTAAVPRIDKNHYLFIENKIQNEEIIGRTIVNAPDSTQWNAIVPKWWHQRCVGAFRVDPLNRTSCDLYAYVLLACRGYDRPCHVEFCIDGQNLVWDRTFIELSNGTSYDGTSYRGFALSSTISPSLKKVILDHWAVQGSSFALVRNAIAMVNDSYGSSSSSGSSSGSSSRPTKRQKTVEVEVVEVAHNTVDEVLRNKLKKAEEEGKVIYLS